MPTIEGPNLPENFNQTDWAHRRPSDRVVAWVLAKSGTARRALGRNEGVNIRRVSDYGQD